MMTPDQREHALDHMQQAAYEFSKAAVRIGNQPFLDFSGLMHDYITACKAAHAEGLDFSECTRHSGLVLPLDTVMSAHINEKLARIFSGSKILEAPPTPPSDYEGFAIPPHGRPA